MAFLDETGLAELWSLIKAEDAKAPKIATGSYVGTGTYGSSNPCSLTFDFTPRFVYIYLPLPSGTSASYAAPLSFVYKYNGISWAGQSQYAYPTGVTVTWGDSNDVSWFTSRDITQCNIAGYEYAYIAIG